MTLLALTFVPIKRMAMKYFAKSKNIMDKFIVRNQEYANWFDDTAGGVREIRLFNVFDKKYNEFVPNQERIINKEAGEYA